MKAVVQWQGDAAFCADVGSGHRLTIDGPPEHGGKNKGARPMEVFLSGAAACSAFDVVHILKKSRQPLVDLKVQADGQRAEQEPKVYTHIHLHFVAIGSGLSDSAVARAVQLSVEKYCSALKMLAASCKISYSHCVENK